MWTYISNIPAFGDILDVATINENFAAISRASAGSLGEHAWSAAFVSASDKMFDDIAVRQTYRDTARDPLDSAVWTVLGLSQTWREVDQDGATLNKTFTTRGGLVYVEASFGSSNANTLAGISPGLCFGIMVDGAVRHETVVGSGDVGSDDMRSGAGYKFSAGTGFVINSDGYGPGVRATQTGFVLVGVLRLPAGQHRVSVCYRNPSAGDNASPQYLTQGELTVLELWS